MPRYDVVCRRCELTIEIQRPMNQPNPPCPTCGGPVEQLPPTSMAFALKGAGWTPKGKR